ncbi:hypothetical protein [Streptomyces flavofungini]|uniref:DUF2188 domain-containing protein n=1 Tax=Streptomyces flavofungini TaxID=68200 RepID=A0ABS0X7W7_9ACTN|nr:hypothetical protein [Streptomyces flavofungini]MBJ3809229.1 hypothetical protein [Streptomyces flavofungini]
MAHIKIHTSKSDITSYRVVWCAGGTRDGKWQGEMFDDEVMANRFRDLVNGHGQQWPPVR